MSRYEESFKREVEQIFKGGWGEWPATRTNWSQTHNPRCDSQPFSSDSGGQKPGESAAQNVLIRTASGHVQVPLTGDALIKVRTTPHKSLASQPCQDLPVKIRDDDSSGKMRAMLKDFSKIVVLDVFISLGKPPPWRQKATEVKKRLEKYLGESTNCQESSEGSLQVYCSGLWAFF